MLVSAVSMNSNKITLRGVNKSSKENYSNVNFTAGAGKVVKILNAAGDFVDEFGKEFDKNGEPIDYLQRFLDEPPTAREIAVGESIKWAEREAKRIANEPFNYDPHRNYSPTAGY